jgi:hypothetical protein
MNPHRHEHEPKPGIGLYTHEQVKNTTPFQYAAQVVVGTIVLGTGLMFTIFGYRTSGITIMVIGAFIAHAGVIFWWKRLRKSTTQV